MKKYTRGFITGSAISTVLIIGAVLLLSGCAKLKGDKGDPGATGNDGQSIKGDEGDPAPSCSYFCHGRHKLYIRCDGNADVVVTVYQCEGRQG